MSTRRPGTCGEPGPRTAHCTLDRLHDLSCYDAGEDVSWNEGQWYDFDLAPHDCGDPECPDQGYRGPDGRESEHVAGEVEDIQQWQRTVEGAVESIIVATGDGDGTARVPEPVLAQLLVDAGWERTA